MRKKLVIVVALLWVLAIGAFVLSRELIVQGGQEIFLKTVPVDPRDLFRGDYVVLRFDISTFDPAKFGLNSSDLKYNQPLYVQLSLKDGIASIASISTRKLIDGLFIKGRFDLDIGRRSDALGIRYGIENYFIPEGKGNIPALRDANLMARVKVNNSGEALVVGLWLNGHEISFQ